MANFSGSAIRKTAGKTTRALALAATTMAAVTAPALAGDFTQDECKVIVGTASGVVRAAGAKKLSVEFRKSFLNWAGENITCDGPKDIIVTSHEDSVAYGAIRLALLSGSKPISLEKAGLRVVITEKAKVSSAQPPQRRTDATPTLKEPAVN